MRPSIVLAALAVFLPAVSFGQEAARKEFSHKLHLSLKLQCVSCHASVTGSKSASDNNLPDGVICRSCHEQVRIKEPSKRKVDRFSHAQHIAMGRIGDAVQAAIKSGSYLGYPAPDPALYESQSSCGGCHRGIEQAERITGDHFPAMADCLVCHSRVDNPFSCEKCHTVAPAELKPASHTADFIDLHSSGKWKFDKQTCTVCHGRRFTCLGCH